MTNIFERNEQTIFSRVEAEWAEDSQIDHTDLEMTTIKTAKMISKYLQYLNAAKKYAREKDAELKKLVMLRAEWYMGNLELPRLKELGWQPNQKRVLKTEVMNYVKTDDLVIDMTTLKAEADDLVVYLDNIVKTIGNRGFLIKNIIETRKFLNNAH